VEQRQLTAEVKDGSTLGFVVGETIYVHRQISLPQSSATFTRVSLAGGAERPTTVAGMYPWATDGKHWYGCKAPVGVLGSDCRVARAPVAGGTIEELALVKGAHMNVFAVDDTTVYVGVETSGARGAIMAVPIAGGEAKPLLETSTRVASIAADRGSVYFSATSPDTGIYALERGESKAVKLAPVLSFELAVYRDYVYFADLDGVQRVPKKGGAPEWIARAGAQGRSVDGLIVAGEVLYFGVTGANQPMELRSIALPVLAPTP
jgi:hypothetical protein